MFRPNYDVTLEGATVTIDGNCLVTGKRVTVQVPVVSYIQWKRGNATIQDAFPNLSADEREFILTGFSGEGFDQYLGGDTEDIEMDFGFSHFDPNFSLDMLIDV